MQQPVSNGMKRPGRRYTATNSSMNNGPIKIKKLIPTKKSLNNQNKQSLQSVFTGRANMARITNDNTTNFSDNDDDIERDTTTATAAAEIIKPKTFRRISS